MKTNHISNKPDPLVKGDTIALIATSSYIANPFLVEDVKKFLESNSFKVKVNPNILEQYLDYAGSAQMRACDIMASFINPEIKAIMCLRGGNGCMQVLNHLDFKAIAQNPKIVLGYSDVCHLLLALNQKANMVTYLGSTGQNLLDNELNWKMLLKVCSKKDTLLSISDYNKSKIYVINSGHSQGQITGGCLTILCQTLGTDYEIVTDNKILIIEDVGEEPYNIDKMLTRLLLAGKFDRINGVVLGQFINCKAGQSNRNLAQKSHSIEKIFLDFFSKFKFPVIYGLDFGHGYNNFTIPIGNTGIIDTSNSTMFKIEI